MELGKAKSDTCNINKGIEQLEIALALSKDDEVLRVMRAHQTARKIESLMMRTINRDQTLSSISDLKSKMATLNKLFIVFKVPKNRRLDTKALLNSAKEACQKEEQVAVNMLHVPDHLVCNISGDLMKEPVTLQSGITYER